RPRSTPGQFASKAPSPSSSRLADGLRPPASTTKGERAANASAKQKNGNDDTKPPILVTKTIPKKPDVTAHPAKPPPPVAKRTAAPTPPGRPRSERARATEVHRATWAPPGTRHPGGFAIDVAVLHKKDGRWLSVAHMFHGRLGEKTCGAGARTPDDPDGKLM